MGTVVTGEQLREILELHTTQLGYALAAIAEERPVSPDTLLKALRRAMVVAQDSTESEVADAATAPFLWLIQGAEDFLSDAQEMDSV